MEFKGLSEKTKKALKEFSKAKREGLDIYSDFAGDCFLVEVFKYEEYYEEKSTLITNVDTSVNLSTANVGKSISAADLALAQTNSDRLVKKGPQLKERRLFPICKILAVGNSVPKEYEKYKVGDVVRISDSLLKPKLNPDWQEWHEKTNGGQAKGIEAVQPPRFVYGFEIFSNNNHFKENPFAHVEEISNEDLFTYYIGSSYIKCKMDVAKIVK